MNVGISIEVREEETVRADKGGKAKEVEGSLCRVLKLLHTWRVRG